MSDLTRESFDKFLDENDIMDEMSSVCVEEEAKKQVIDFLPMIDRFLTEFFKLASDNFNDFYNWTKVYLESLDGTNEIEVRGIKQFISDAIDAQCSSFSDVPSWPEDVDTSLANYFLIIRNLLAIALNRSYKFAPDFME